MATSALRFEQTALIAAPVNPDWVTLYGEMSTLKASSALKLMHQIIETRYSPAEWNIYAAQASDGDNWNDDSPVCSKILADRILPLVQYYSYVEITPQDHQTLWYEYEKVMARNPDSFAMEQIADPGEIYPVFRQLFERKAA